MRTGDDVEWALAQEESFSKLRGPKQHLLLSLKRDQAFRTLVETAKADRQREKENQGKPPTDPKGPK